MKFMSVVIGLIFFIVGAVIVLTVLPALLPTFYGSLNSTYYYSYYENSTAACQPAGCTYTLPLRNLFSTSGILPLVLVAGVFVALVIGAIAMIKSKGKK